MKRMTVALSLLILTISLFSQHEEQDLLKWRGKRLASLTSENGWITLAGLFWLKEGDNSLGRNPENNLIANYPDFPEKAGVFKRQGENVEFLSESGVAITHDGNPVARMVLTDDREGQQTILRYQGFSWYLIVRGDRLGIRMKWKDHPNRHKLTELPAYAYSPAWRITGQFHPYEQPKKMTVASVIGTQSEEDCPGEIHLTVQGQNLILYPTGTREEMSLMFGDATNGKESYDGGRFLPLSTPNDRNEIIVDFNYAYNPPCVFTPFATCPVPVSENILTVRIEAGEKMVELFHH